MRVERLQEEVELELDIFAYDLKPGLPPEGISRKDASPGRSYPPGYIDNLIQTANDAGIEMKRPPLIPNTRKAHEATEFARENGQLQQFHRAMFHAYFEEERNIGDIDVLCDIGAGNGLDAEMLRAALEDGRYASMVEEQIEWGRAAGVTGVPTYIFNEKFALVGAQDYTVFSDLAARIARGALKSEDSV
ncbi:MAG: DsbA family protein [Chloroflexi bacterium]|nr:DsbA family protein [Chloroflexota bacterium]